MQGDWWVASRRGSAPVPGGAVRPCTRTSVPLD